MLENARRIKAEDIINEIDGYIDDVYVVDIDFSWTYIHTHEYFCGPYFLGGGGGGGGREREREEREREREREREEREEEREQDIPVFQ